MTESLLAGFGQILERARAGDDQRGSASSTSDGCSWEEAERAHEQGQHVRIHTPNSEQQLS